MSNASTFRCSNCLAHKNNLCVCGKARTVAMLAKDYKRFIEQGGGNRDLGKLFNCVVDRPLFFGTLEECEQCDDLVSDFSPPGELHLMLGIVNQFVKEMGQISPQIIEDWIKDSNVSAAGYWQGTFEGNQCKKLLDNIEFLLDEYGYPKVPILGAYIKGLKSFNGVVHACFGVELHEDYEEKIKKFKGHYMVLVDDFGVSISVKAHEIFFHVAPWLKKWGIPLGVISEQTSESLHSDFANFIERKGVSNPDAPHFAENLLKVIVAYNSSHI